MKVIKTLIILVFVFGFVILVKPIEAYQFPVFELGNCRDQKECHLYCEVPRNRAACWSYNVYGVRNVVLGNESPEERVAQLGITFPIPELGNCANVAQCKAYCNDPANATVCKSFAQNRGLKLKTRISEKAKAELGCSSADECRAYCEQEVNRETCLAFAKRYHLKAAVRNKLVEAVQSELGCDSKETCHALCELPENKVKCQTIAQRLGIGENKKEELVNRAKEELGCTSFEDCRQLCQNKENAERCRNFGQAVGQSIKNRIRDAGDCTTVEECKRVCETNPERCPNFPKIREGSKPAELRSGFQNRLEFRRDNRGPGSLNKGPKKPGQFVDDDSLNDDENESETEIENELSTDDDDQTNSGNNSNPSGSGGTEGNSSL